MIFASPSHIRQDFPIVYRVFLQFRSLETSPEEEPIISHRNGKTFLDPPLEVVVVRNETKTRMFGERLPYRGLPRPLLMIWSLSVRPRLLLPIQVLIAW